MARIIDGAKMNLIGKMSQNFVKIENEPTKTFEYA